MPKPTKHCLTHELARPNPRHIANNPALGGIIFPEGNQMDLAKLIQEKREQILELAAKYGAEDVRVFGSVARGDFDAKSDIDFLIKLDSSKFEGLKFFGALEDLQEGLEALLGCKVDIVTEDGLREKIKAEVLAEAKAI